MSQHQVGGISSDGIVDRTRATAGSAADATSPYATPANYASLSALDTRLNAISGTIYAQSVLDKMTVNDKIYALRLNDDAGTV